MGRPVREELWTLARLHLLKNKGLLSDERIEILSSFRRSGFSVDCSVTLWPLWKPTWTADLCRLRYPVRDRGSKRWGFFRRPAYCLPFRRSRSGGTDRWPSGILSEGPRKPAEVSRAHQPIPMLDRDCNSKMACGTPSSSKERIPRSGGPELHSPVECGWLEHDSLRTSLQRKRPEVLTPPAFHWRHTWLFYVGRSTVSIT